MSIKKDMFLQCSTPETWQAQSKGAFTWRYLIGGWVSNSRWISTAVELLLLFYWISFILGVLFTWIFAPCVYEIQRGLKSQRRWEFSLSLPHRWDSHNLFIIPLFVLCSSRWKCFHCTVYVRVWSRKRVGAILYHFLDRSVAPLHRRNFDTDKVRSSGNEPPYPIHFCAEALSERCSGNGVSLAHFRILKVFTVTSQ